MRLRRAVVFLMALGMTALSACVGSSYTPASSTAPNSPLHSSPTPATAGASASVASFGLQTPSAKEMDASLNVDRVVPAGGSIDVPIAFEGTSQARVTISASTPGVTASLAGTNLAGGTISGKTLLQTSPLANPADGTLHIVNPGTSESTVMIIATIFTTRHLTITPATRTVGKGDTVSFTVSVNEPGASEAATAYLVDPSGTKTPIALTATGTGAWTGQATVTTSGANKIEAQTAGDRPRYAEAGISVASGTIAVAPGFTEQLVDTDHDGLANYLRLTITVTTDAPGDYVLDSLLVSSTGQEVDPRAADVHLVAGTQQVSIEFLGEVIYKSGISGPYRLTNVTFIDTTTGRSVVEAAAADLGATQAYDYKVFQH